MIQNPHRTEKNSRPMVEINRIIPPWLIGLIDLAEYLEEVNKKFIVSTSSLDKFVQKTVINLNSINNIYRNIIDNFTKTTQKIFDEINKNLKKFNKVAERYSMIMIEMGWPPSLQLYFNEMLQIISSYDNTDRQEFANNLNDCIEKRHDKEQLKSILKEWKQNKWLSKRLPILEQVIQAHNDGKYFISIPALLPQIQGIIADRYEHKKKMTGKQFEEYINRLLKKGAFDKAIEKYFIEVVLVQFNFGESIKSFLSRHAILHGADVKYGTAINSLKCILLFDYLQLRLNEE